MKLKDLKDNTRPDRWSEPGAMRWNLDLGSLEELANDVEEAIQRARQEGEKHATEKASQEPPKRGTMAFAAAYEQGWIEAMLSAPPRHGVAQGWGAPATEERQALTARLRAQEEFAQTLRRELDEAREAIRIGVASDNDQDKRLAALESYVQDTPEPFPPSTKYGELAARVENIERGVTSPAQLVPDMLKRVQRLEMSLETCLRPSDLEKLTVILEGKQQ